MHVHPNVHEILPLSIPPGSNVLLDFLLGIRSPCFLLLMPAEALAVQGFAQLAGQRLLQPESQELPL